MPNNSGNPRTAARPQGDTPVFDPIVEVSLRVGRRRAREPLRQAPMTEMRAAGDQVPTGVSRRALSKPTNNP
jgi:hypothetical protein